MFGRKTNLMRFAIYRCLTAIIAGMRTSGHRQSLSVIFYRGLLVNQHAWPSIATFVKRRGHRPTWSTEFCQTLKAMVVIVNLGRQVCPWSVENSASMW